MERITLIASGLLLYLIGAVVFQQMHSRALLDQPFQLGGSQLIPHEREIKNGESEPKAQPEADRAPSTAPKRLHRGSRKLTMMA